MKFLWMWSKKVKFIFSDEMNKVSTKVKIYFLEEKIIVQFLKKVQNFFSFIYFYKKWKKKDKFVETDEFTSFIPKLHLIN